VLSGVGCVGGRYSMTDTFTELKTVVVTL